MLEHIFISKEKRYMKNMLVGIFGPVMYAAMMSNVK